MGSLSHLLEGLPWVAQGLLTEGGRRLHLQVKGRHWLTVLSDVDTQQEQMADVDNSPFSLQCSSPTLLVSSKNHPWLGLCLFFFSF